MNDNSWKNVRVLGILPRREKQSEEAETIGEGLRSHS